MKFLIAPDSFKDSLSAKEVGLAIQRGIYSEMDDAEIKILPMADGGEGTVQSLVDATQGKIIQAEVHDPLMRKIKAHFGILGDGTTAVIEMAAASGIELLKPEERDPWKTTTYGTGELIRAAMDKGCRRIIIGIGGSGTNDAGVGMAMALGIKFMDNEDKFIKPAGGEVGRINRIDVSQIDSRIGKCEITAACDVNNSFTGQTGASYVYGPQKGADSEKVKKLDENLHHLAIIIQEQLHIDIENIPGSGAAGGLGGGLMAFCNATLQPGFEIVRKETRIDEYVKWADIVFTGEGRMDYQTQFGKTPMGVAGITKQFNKPVIAIAGTLGEGYSELYNLGFDAIFSIIERPMELNEALITSPELIERCAKAIACILKIKTKS